MAKTKKELAFLRDLYIDEEWTRRFTDLVDKHLGFSDDGDLLYINAGTGNHVLTLGQKAGAKAACHAVCENDEILKIARDKAAAVRSKVSFSTAAPSGSQFSAVVADASLVRPSNLGDLVAKAVAAAAPDGRAALVAVTAGSFGEIFSLLWEVFFNAGLGENGAAAERLITELPTVSMIEEMAREAGLTDLESHTVTEEFDFENGRAFAESPLVADFFLPVWLEGLSNPQKKKVVKNLVRLIDDEDGSLSFRFTVKATLVTGRKG